VLEAPATTENAARVFHVFAAGQRAVEGTGHSHLQDSHHDQGIAFLRQALATYQRIGVPAARRVQDTLASHGSLTGQGRYTDG
jgi:hypothetical protein